MDCFLGIDIGNSKSHALIADEQGQALGFGRAGSGSWEAVGWDRARSVLHDITRQALAQARVDKADVRGAGFGFAGYDWPEDRLGHERLVASLELPTRTGACAACVLGNDTLVGLMAGAGAGWGVVVVAGTSNNCRGRDRLGREGRVTGMGPRFGEYGGAGEIVRRAVQAIAAAWSKRGPETRLSEAFLALTGAHDVSDLLAGLVRGRYELGATAAPTIFAVAHEGDAVAQEVIAWAGRELGGLANGVIRQLDLEDEAFDVVLSGSVYDGGSLLMQEMRMTIVAVAARARLVRLQAPPVVGGVLLGMQQAGLDTGPLRPTLIETTNHLLHAYDNELLAKKQMEENENE